ncbi:probable serine/threonine-protein kinase clkA [Bactrocera neohumeralis]|uniref:probable serine/threonine-protein kinase clkA n=1 Tax=Bactrocera neohumeralis TaxID=98809 RepID=UPI0021668EDA|nr:probable serine/threonine-protein kinase clkA [Bactrocera neohumeralis]
MDALEVSKFNLILSCIKNIESFDGNDQNQLPDFISQVENIIPSISEFDNTNRCILFGYNFGEKFSSNDLMDNLKTCRLQGTTENYYFQINKLANRIHNRNLTHGDNTYTTSEINRISLKTFRDHLPEPTRTMIFARNPTTLEDAFQIILDARHQGYTQFGPAKQGYLSTNTTRTDFSNNYRNPNKPIKILAPSYNRQYDNKYDESHNTGNDNNYNNHNFGNNYTPLRQNQRFPTDNLDHYYDNNAGSSRFTGQTRRSNYSQAPNTNIPKYTPNNNLYQTRQSNLINDNKSLNSSNQQVVPMEIGNSNVNFPIVGEETFLT